MCDNVAMVHQFLKQSQTMSQNRLKFLCSGYTDISFGVPQGSCTGPLLCMYTTVCLFADDIRTSILFSSVSERRVMKERLIEFMVWGGGGGSF